MVRRGQGWDRVGEENPKAKNRYDYCGNVILLVIIKAIIATSTLLDCLTYR